jgi:chemotaxis protein CheX
MLNLELQAIETDQDVVLAPLELNGVSGGVSFTGKMTGILYLNMTENLSRIAANSILGDNPNRPVDEINDVIGELTNMVTGNLKSKMADRGFNCTLSIPTVIRGLKISIDSTQPTVSLFNSLKLPDSDDLLNICIFARLEE